MRGATVSPSIGTHPSLFQSTLLMRGATSTRALACWNHHFNPRSSCEERLPPLSQSCEVTTYFNPRSSCEERRFGVVADDKDAVFQSTLLMRGATDAACVLVSLPTYFNPRSSCEERLCYFQALICLTSSYIFREPLTSFRKHFF